MRNAAPKTYGYDNDGNRIIAGTARFTYNSRNQVITSPAGRSTWSPRGTLQSVTGGTKAATFSFDALSQLTSYNGSVSYSYDGLGRIAQRNGHPFAYSGTDPNPVSDGSALYATDPAGNIVAVRSHSTSHIVQSDPHGDLSLFLSPTGSVDGSRFYRPFGRVKSTSGTAESNAGFQGQFTDPTTGMVFMGSRVVPANHRLI